MAEDKRLAKTTVSDPARKTQAGMPPPPPPMRGGSAGGAGAVMVPGYTITREISRGGQGAVYEATHNATTRRVAIKVIAGGATSTAREKARFDQEAKILAALDHPGIVRVLDRGTTIGGSMYLVMDFISGRPLTDFLDRGNTELHSQDPADLLRMFLKIADAVNAAHLRGVVHRDIKPANIIVDEHREPHILDFGLARTGISRYADAAEREPVTITGTFLGSLPWSSPEQADGQTDKIDTRTDVYALGVILYQMLTGEFPYATTGTMREILTNISEVQPTPPSRLLESREGRALKRGIRLKMRRGKLNPIIDSIVLKALAKKREERYQSAGELARDIGNYLSGRPTVAVGGTTSALMRPVVLIPTCIAAGMLICGIIFYVATRNNAPVSTAAPIAMPATEPSAEERGRMAMGPPPNGGRAHFDNRQGLENRQGPENRPGGFFRGREPKDREPKELAATKPAVAETEAVVVATAPATVSATKPEAPYKLVLEPLPPSTYPTQTVTPPPVPTEAVGSAEEPVHPDKGSNGSGLLSGQHPGNMQPGELPAVWEPGMPLPPAIPAGAGRGPGGQPPQGNGPQNPGQNPGGPGPGGRPGMGPPPRR